MENRVTKKKKIQKDSYKQKILVENGVINNLPDDCLLHIFSFLSVKDLQTAEEVCSRWANVVPKAWRTLRNLNLNELDETKPIFWDVWSRCGRFLTKLEFTLSFNDGPSHKKILLAITEHCRSLKEIIIRFYGCSDRECPYLQELFKANKELRRIRFENVSTISIKQKSRLFQALPGSMKKISVSRFIPGENKRRYPLPLEILSKFKKLNFLKLENFVIHQHEFEILLSFKALTTLKLYNVSLTKNCVIDLALLENLENLELSCITNLTSEFFDNLAGKCKKLTCLRLRDCQPITEFSLCYLSQSSALQNLSLERCHGKEITEGFQYLSGVRRFTFTHYNTPDGAAWLKRGISSIIGTAFGLEFINLSSTCITYRILKKVIRKVITTRGRTSKLEVVVPDAVRDEWFRKGKKSSLVVITSASKYNKNRKCKK